MRSIQFVEEGDAQCEVGIGKKLDCLSLGGICKKGRDVLFDRALFEQIGEDLRSLGALADDDARRMKVVVKRPALTQKLRGKNQVPSIEALACLGCIANRDGRFDDHNRIGVDLQDILDDRLDRTGVEIVGFRVVIGGRCNDDEICTLVGILPIQGRPEIDLLVLEIFLDFSIGNRGVPPIEQRHFVGNDIQRDNFVILSQKEGVGEPK